MLVLVAAVGITACAASRYPDLDEPLPAGAQSGPKAAAEAQLVVPGEGEGGGALVRADVERVVDAGLGTFLSDHVEVEAAVTAGKFAGWSIVALTPNEFFQTVDLRPGDVVTRVNGRTIERETEAYDAFQAVRGADALEVVYLRQGRARTLRYRIIGQPSAALPVAALATPAQSADAASKPQGSPSKAEQREKARPAGKKP